jgi:hypothetical protein
VEVFLRQTSQQVQWHSVTTVTQEGTWAPCSPPTAGARRRCPVKPSTPLGSDQVNVLLCIIIIRAMVQGANGIAERRLAPSPLRGISDGVDGLRAYIPKGSVGWPLVGVLGRMRPA